MRALPDPERVAQAADLLASARRPLVLSGRGARNAGASLLRLLDTLGAVHVDTGESRGLVPEGHRSVVAAMRGSVMGEADVVLTVGRRLDFQLAYGSPAVFGDARFIRVADVTSELRDNRRGAVEILADCGATIDHALANRPALLDVVVSPDAVSSDARSGLAWVPDLQPLAAWDEAEGRFRSARTED